MNQFEFYKKALEITPWATQTYSKRPFPGTEDVMPLFCRKAKGSRFRDYDNNEYVDFFCSCGPIILGHHHEPVDDRVKEQIDNGFLYSVASEKEYELSEKLVGMFPSTNWVKYLKSGAEATSAAVRIARIYTKKEKILQCGYHGWHDWYQSVTLGCGKETGIPSGMNEYTIPFRYNDADYVESVLKNDDNIAGVIIVPYNWIDEPEVGFLQELRKICDRYGVLLIYDEVKTGFRIDLKGAQGYYDVYPDITCFGKAISNGYPLAAVCGRKGLKGVFDNKALITTTFGGDALSLTAAIYTIDELSTNDAIGSIYSVGTRLIEGLKRISDESGIDFEVKGKAPISTVFFNTGDAERDAKYSLLFSRINFMKGMFVKIVGGPSYTLCYAHSIQDIDRALDVADYALKEIKKGVGIC
jgi:Glutamate-1-semialdehyde aminotransferase